MIRQGWNVCSSMIILVYTVSCICTFIYFYIIVRIQMYPNSKMVEPLYLFLSCSMRQFINYSFIELDHDTTGLESPFLYQPYALQQSFHIHFTLLVHVPTKPESLYCEEIITLRLSFHTHHAMLDRVGTMSESLLHDTRNALQLCMSLWIRKNQFQVSQTLTWFNKDRMFIHLRLS